MNLTDDMLQLKKTADAINKAGKIDNWLDDKSQKTTYYKKRNSDENKGLVVYNVKSGVDLRQELYNQWQNKECMKEFIPVCMVAAGKNKLKKNSKDEEHQISPYIYVF